MSTPQPTQELDPLVGQTVAERYRVDELLGVGGMGAVYRCHHLGLRRDLAMKVLHPELARDPHLSARFDREAQSASRLDHPNCIQVTDFGSWTAPGSPAPMKYMVMQFLRGTELTNLLGSPLDPLRAVQLTLQIVRGLEHAHEHGIAHRDLKPENVFVAADHEGGEVLKLVDFGIAKILHGEGAGEQMTRAGMVFGTPRYMSPEQATGATVDHRADLYACGIILYQMLAGETPFHGDDPIDLLRRQILEPPPPLPGTVDVGLRATVFKLLEKRADDRFQTASEARDALEQVLVELTRQSAAGTGTSNDFVGSPTLLIPAAASALRRFSLPERRTLFWGGIATGGLVLAGLVAIASNGDETSTQPPAQPAGFELAQVLGLSDKATDPPAEVLSEIDRLILAQSDIEAGKAIEPLLGSHPDSPQLLWRRGKLFARESGKSADALAAYGDAVKADPDLLQDRDFYAELMDLMKRPEVLDSALDLALDRLQGHADTFLLKLVNRETKALGFVARHRALDGLADSKEQKLINVELNRALDLWQAGQAPDPCRAFADGLRAIENDPSPYYLGTLESVAVPVPTAESGSGADCDGLQNELSRVRTALQTNYAGQNAPRTVPADYAQKKTKRRKGVLRRIFGG